MAWKLNLETIASRDRYRFTIPAGGATVQYQDLSGWPNYRNYTLTNTTTGATVGTGLVSQKFVLPAGGYRLEFADQGVATCSFNLFVAPTSPGVPVIGAVTAGNASATLMWTAPANGGSAITGYTVTANPGGRTATTTGGTTATVTGLTKGTAYTFAVSATNAVGTSPASAPSASVTLLATGPPRSRST